MFPVPKGYKRTFIFKDAATKFMGKIVVDDVGVHISTHGHAGGLTGSLCLDWIAQSITQVREGLGV